MPGTCNGDAGRVGIDLDDLLSRRKVTSDPGMDFHIARKARIESQMQLAGHNGPDGHISRVVDLLRGEIERAFAGLGVSQVDLRLDVIGAQLTDDTLRPANADLCLRNRLGADFEVRRNVLKD